MGLFSKVIGNKVKNAAGELKRLENRDLLEAICGGCLLVAGADGDLEKSELDNLEKIIRSNKMFDGFGNEITEIMNRFKEQLEAGFRVARLKILREIREVKSNPADAEEVFICMVTVAEADGEIEESEKKVLKEVAQELNLRLSDYGLE